MITLNASGGSVSFTFSGNSTYLNDGVITCPVNSLALIADESDMVTFRKSASNDIFVSANIAEFGMTKDELIAWYKANMVSSGGGGGGVNVVQTTGTSNTDVMSQDAVTTQLNGKADAIGIDMVRSPRKKVTFQLKSGGNNGTTISSRDLTLGRGLVYGEEGFTTLSTSGLVETSAITTSITSGSTDSQVPSAKAVYNTIGNINSVLNNI